MWKFWRRKQKKRYDGVKIVNVVDGTTIEGHEAVAAYFAREQARVDAHGSTITFQLFRLDLNATTLAELQGEKLAEVRVDGSWVSGDDTVAMVKDRVRQLFKDKATAADRITFYFNSQPMQ